MPIDLRIALNASGSLAILKWQGIHNNKIATRKPIIMTVFFSNNNNNICRFAVALCSFSYSYSFIIIIVYTFSVVSSQYEKKNYILIIHEIVQVAKMLLRSAHVIFHISFCARVSFMTCFAYYFTHSYIIPNVIRIHIHGRFICVWIFV